MLLSNQYPELFLSCKIGTILIKNMSPFPPPPTQLLATILLSSASRSLTTLGTSFKWNHSVCDGLNSFCLMSSRFI